MGNTYSTLRQKLGYDEVQLKSRLNADLPQPPSYAAATNHKTILEHSDETDLFKKIIEVAKAPLEDFDPGVFSEELINLGIVGRVDPEKAHGQDGFQAGDGNIEEGTYAGTQAALTQVYSLIEQR